MWLVLQYFGVTLSSLIINQKARREIIWEPDMTFHVISWSLNSAAVQDKGSLSSLPSHRRTHFSIGILGWGCTLAWFCPPLGEQRCRKTTFRSFMCFWSLEEIAVHYHLETRKLAREDKGKEKSKYLSFVCDQTGLNRARRWYLCIQRCWKWWFWQPFRVWIQLIWHQ